MTWRESAACAKVDGAPWDTSLRDKPAQATAVAICHICPIQSRCLTEALDLEGRDKTRLRWGIWGGTTPEERHQMSKEGRRA